MREFMRAIAENLEDDLPKLVYADWLEEQGDEIQACKAQLIRLHCEWKRYRRIHITRPDENTPKWFRDLYERYKITELEVARIYWDQNQPGFQLVEPEVNRSIQDRIVELQKIYPTDYSSVREKRFLAVRTKCGLLTGLTAYMKRFVEHARLLFEHHPLCDLQFVDTTGGKCFVLPEPFFRTPWLENLRYVFFKGQRVDSNFIDHLVNSEYTSCWNSLRFERTPLIGSDISSIINRLPNLRSLTLDRFPEVIEIEKPNLTHLAINLSAGGSIEQLTVDRIHTQFGLQNLKSLELRGNFLVPMEEIPHIALPPFSHLQSLERFEIEGIRIGGENFERMIHEMAFTHLKYLSLRNCDISGNSIQRVVDCQIFQSIQELTLSGNFIRQSDVEILRQRWPNIQIWTDDFQ